MNSMNEFVLTHFPGESNYQSEQNQKFSDDNSQSKALSEKSREPKRPKPLKLAKFYQKNQGTEIESGQEKVIDEFTCAAELRILIQGKLFVSN